MKSLLITGDRSGSGKTSVTLALAAILSRKYRVQPFKVAMDYIDPSYLTGVTGRPCRNLDSFVMSTEEIRTVFENGCRGADIAIVEGVRGLYEGAEAIGDSGSTADIAKKLNLNVILVVDARSITRSAAALVKGFADFDPEVNICGVILNQVRSETHREKASRAIEHFCGIPVIGAIPKTDDMHLTMRHLGLVPFLEGRREGEFMERIEAITGLIEEHVDMERLLELAGETEAPVQTPEIFRRERETDLRIGVALDEAFNFYYSDIFDILPALGAEPVPFSPIHDRLPEADGYILGGGYPELFASALEANDSMKEAVLEVSGNGVPIYAECGGLNYLTERIVLGKGWQGSEAERSFAMCGVFEGETRMPAHRVIGYVRGVADGTGPLGAGEFAGHEFHHSDVRLSKDTHYSYRLSRGTGISGGMDGAVVSRTQAAYTHIHPVSSYGMMQHFVKECRRPL